jgi:DUF1707 SHOCT-like domain/Cell wall-active antibiotics response LiaF, C-terminal
MAHRIYLLDMTSRNAPRDLRASDADRDRVLALLAEAASDGRLTADEHAERVVVACSARTLGELAGLTADLAAPSAQPVRVDSGRVVSGLFGSQRREGRWVVPEGLAVTAVFGEVVLDFREALLQSRRVTVYATAVGGKVRLIVPEGLTAEITRTSLLGRRASRRGAGGAAGASGPVIEVRAFVLGGEVEALTPQRPRRRWFGLLPARRDWLAR